MSIYVGNLAYEINQEDLSEVFNEYGSVQRVDIPTDRETGRARGFAFVEMKSEANENKAIKILNGAEWMGRDIKVDKAKPRDSKKSFAGYRVNTF
ncbi:RNA recognition motif domain-containing protein [Pleurocapsa sp. FMAR1]|uniref:RNA recognition motif domain-containing protein n=1 Tax=Pleurocapsa sp. FMAR1 TaxID=3040204 RepID=UPI0029C9B1EE|nr:RNA-binding protein [Pleurocapsa sp. FMAR1]